MNINIKRYGHGKPLVFFHGWGFNSKIWYSLIPLLEAHYELILIDLPGFGATDLMEWQEFKFKLLLVLPTEFSLAGWSLGGLLATRLAIEEPQRVRYLLNINSSPRFISDISWPGVQKELFDDFHTNLSIDSNNTLKEFITLQQGSKSSNFIIEDGLNRKGLENGLNILQTWDLREPIKSLITPVSYMFGRLDRIIPSKTMGAMQVLYPNFNYILFNKAAHMPFISHPELFVSTLLEII